MATQRREISLTSSAEHVWSAVRDFSQVHTRVAPGFMTALEMLEGDRVVTFFNGMVARERLVTRDDVGRRLVYAIVDGRARHYNAALEVFRASPEASRLVWTIDVLPDELAPLVGAMMDQAAGAVKKTLSA